MAEFLKKIRPGSIVGFILCIVFGVVVCIWPGTVMIIACRIAGALLLACGIYNLIMGARNQNMAVRGFQITAGLVLCVVGVWILAAPGTFLKLIPVVIGLVLIYHGVKDIYISILVKKGQDKRWWIGTITAVISVVLGVILIRCAFLALEIGMIYLGIVLIYDGISGLWLTSRTGRGKRGKSDDVIDVDYKEV